MFCNAFPVFIFFKNGSPCHHRYAEAGQCINSEKPCIKPRGVGGTTGTSVGTIATNNMPTQKMTRVIVLVLNDLILSSNPIKSDVPANASE